MNSVLKKYLNKTYANTFFPIFLTLYTITSIIFLVKIASLTSVIQINFFELLELYSYNIATILFYTLPVSLFISLGLSLTKLSSEYELIVMTSFGLNPLQIFKMFLPLLLLSSILVLTISLVLIPKSSFLKSSFYNYKKMEAQFNIKASEYGQEFGKWLVYVEKETNGLYEDIVLYQQNGQEDIFIVAKYAKLNNLGNALSFQLREGRVVRMKDGINQIDFKSMVINNEIEQLKELSSFQDLVKYWSIKNIQFSWYSMFSIMPLVLSFFIIVIGYYNPRYDKNRSVVFGLLAVTIYIILIKELSRQYNVSILYFLPFIWLIIGYIFYRYKIKPYY